MSKKRTIGIVSGSIAALCAVSLAAGSYLFTAPGVQINGSDIGLETETSAFTAMNDNLFNTPVNINGKQFTYADLGVFYDEEDIEEIIKNNKLYKINNWNNSVVQAIHIDEEILQKTISKAFPESYADPVESTISLNDDGETWDIKKSQEGTKPIVEDLRKSIEQDLTAENTTDDVKSYELKLEKTAPSITTEDSEKFVEKLNTMADEAGYYEGEDKKVNISRNDFFELVNVEQAPDKDDKYSITPVEDGLKNYAKTIPEKVNVEVDNGEAVVDENGKVLKILDEFNDGYKFEDVEGLTQRSIEQIKEGKSTKFQLEGTITQAKVNEKFRRIDVDLDAREVRTYENEKLVKSYKVAIGKPATPTDKGKFKVFHQTQMMDMGCTPAYDYCTKDVPFATFYNGGEAFHGTWWHSDFGNTNASMRSHGCVNMTVSDSEEIYYFAQTGTPVHVF